jgi:hypothetical protein
MMTDNLIMTRKCHKRSQTPALLCGCSCPVLNLFEDMNPFGNLMKAVDTTSGDMGAVESQVMGRDLLTTWHRAVLMAGC